MKFARANCHFVNPKVRDADEEDKVDNGEDMNHCVSTVLVKILECVLMTYYRFIMVPS